VTSSPDCQILFHWLRKLPGNLAGVAITKDTGLIEDGLLDSIALLELVSFLEETFALTLPLEEFVPENFRSPAAILSLIRRLREPAADG